METEKEAAERFEKFMRDIFKDDPEQGEEAILTHKKEYELRKYLFPKIKDELISWENLSLKRDIKNDQNIEDALVKFQATMDEDRPFLGLSLESKDLENFDDIMNWLLNTSYPEFLSYDGEWFKIWISHVYFQGSDDGPKICFEGSYSYDSEIFKHLDKEITNHPKVQKIILENL